MEIKDIKQAYFIGIKGAGMASVAQILQGRGIQVSGSDTQEIFYTDAILKRLGIFYYEEFVKEHIIKDFDVIVYSTAYNGENNPEIAEALKKKIPIISYPEMLGLLFKDKLGIAVCGTHGKTTTSAILSEALVAAGQDPSAVVGSQVISWQGGALNGNGEYFVAEADEYQNKLQYYNPWSVILTSVDWDHPDFFADFTIYKQVFKDFVKKIPKTGFLVVWGDSSDTLEVSESANCNVLTYGFGADNSYQISIVNLGTKKEEAVQNTNMSQTFEVFYGGDSLGIFETPLAGRHNILNSTAVIAMTHAMGMHLEEIKISLSKTQGTTRRFQTIGNFGSALLIDDYAHHPDEIKATLSGARERYPEKKIWTVFHPHTFSRTKALFQDFAQSFDDTEKVIIIDVYGSAREKQGGVSSQELVALINKYNFGKAEYISTIDEAADYLREKSGEYDILITMGAGDVWKIAQNLKNS